MSNKERRKTRNDFSRYITKNDRFSKQLRPSLYKKPAEKNALYDNMLSEMGPEKALSTHTHIKGLTPQTAHDLTITGWM